jgi:hypothetical protein
MLILPRQRKNKRNSQISKRHLSFLNPALLTSLLPRGFLEFGNSWPDNKKLERKKKTKKNTKKDLAQASTQSVQIQKQTDDTN